MRTHKLLVARTGAGDLRRALADEPGQIPARMALPPGPEPPTSPVSPHTRAAATDRSHPGRRTSSPPSVARRCRRGSRQVDGDHPAVRPEPPTPTPEPTSCGSPPQPSGPARSPLRQRSGTTSCVRRKPVSAPGCSVAPSTGTGPRGTRRPPRAPRPACGSTHRRCSPRTDRTAPDHRRHPPGSDGPTTGPWRSASRPVTSSTTSTFGRAASRHGPDGHPTGIPNNIAVAFTCQVLL